MELRDYLRVARRRWLLIGVTMIAVTALAAVLTQQMQRQYASASSVFVSTTTSDASNALQGSDFAEQRVASYANVVTGQELAQRVVDRLGLKTSAVDLSDKIKASIVPDTVVLTITVTDSDPQRARRINTAVVNQLQRFVTELETPPGKTLPLLKATVVDRANLPTVPVSPKPTRNLALGLMLGALLGLALAVLREVLDTTVKNMDEITALSDTPVLAMLAYDKEVHKKPLISSLSTHAPRLEAFRVLRTNLSFIDVDSTSKAFVVSSSVPGEGKTTTAVNVALAMASAGQQVLLIDGDLRRPQVANLLGLESAVGLTTALVGNASLQQILQTHQPSGLHVLTSGRLPPNPAELLQSRAMGQLLNQVRSLFDVVIIDAPPLLPVTDAALMATQTDGALVVVRYGETTKDQLTGAIARLDAVGSHPLGVIVNMIPQPAVRDSGYTYGYAPARETLAPAQPAPKLRKRRRNQSGPATRAAPPLPEAPRRQARSQR